MSQLVAASEVRAIVGEVHRQQVMDVVRGATFVGALLLATTVVLAIQVWRHVPVAFEERVPGTERKPLAV